MAIIVTRTPDLKNTALRRLKLLDIRIRSTLKMSVVRVGTSLLAIGCLFSDAADHYKLTRIIDGGSLRRKRSHNKQKYSKRIPRRLPIDSSHRRLSVDQELQRFFLPTKEGDNVMNEMDMRELFIQMNLVLPSMSVMSELPTQKPTPSPVVVVVGTPMPTQTPVPTLTDCTNPGTCENRLRQQIYDVSARVGSVETLDDPNSAQSKASAWIVEECGAIPPIDPCDVSLLNLNEQRYALAVMYFSLNGDGWNSGANPGQDGNADIGKWMSGKNYCEWGATIDVDAGSYNQLVCDEFGNVLNLNLQSNNMAGPIPPEIGVLTYMTSYISYFNAQTGPIPTSLGLITPLETFDVESNNMDGDLFKPEYSGPDGLKEIANFRASLNNFVGTIPTDIGQWSKLQNLWFADNEVTGTIPTEIGNCANLGAFLMYSNQISGTLPTELGNLNNLTWIDIEDNQVVGTIPEELYNNLQLEQVILKSNTLEGKISDKVGVLANLSTLWLSFNQLTGSIPTTIGNCVNLGEVELQNNMLTGPLPTEFGNIPTIEFISVEQNQLVGPIPSQLFSPDLAALRILYINNNKLTGQIPDNFGESPRLKDLWMNDNLLSGTLPSISEGEFLFLEELLVNNNDITGVVDESLCLIRNNTDPGGLLGVFHTDCQPSPSGEPPQIQCSCCTACFE